MYNLFTRGDMAFINEYHLVTNNPNIPNTQNTNLETSELLYADVNNLYDHALSMKLLQVAALTNGMACENVRDLQINDGCFKHVTFRLQ